MAELQALFRALTGCEAALVVNNNAAATMLVARGGRRAGSRGGARLPLRGRRDRRLVSYPGYPPAERRDARRCRHDEPDVFPRLRAGNHRRRQRRSSRFIRAISCSPASCIRTPAADLVPLGERHGIPVIDDLGSGALVDTRQFGLAAEPMMQASVASGAHLICASGDKLLGGPQAGIILGQQGVGGEVRRASLRPRLPGGQGDACRVWRKRCATISATIHRTYPCVAHDRCRARHASCPLRRGGRRRWAATVSRGEVRQSSATVGGGSLPGETLASSALTFSASVVRDAGSSLQAFARSLRLGTPGVIARIEGDRLWLDARTVAPDDDDALIATVRAAWHELHSLG